MRLAKRHRFSKHFFLAQVGVSLTKPLELSHDLRVPDWSSDLLGELARRHKGNGVTTRLPKRFAPSLQNALAIPKGMHCSDQAEALPMLEKL
jgi:hypothetical protein